MIQTLLYVLTVLIWGSTWFAIKFQLGVVSPMASVGYRFSLAAAILLLWSLVRGTNLLFTKRDHILLAAQGLFLFCLNYHLAYMANQHLPSGVNAVGFSSVLVFNTVNASLFFKQRISLMTAVGVFLGLIGIGLVFFTELLRLRFSTGCIVGIVLSVAGAAASSIGTMISVHTQRKSLPVMATNTFSMGYGSLFTFLFLIVTHHSFEFDFSFSYITSLLYLSILGSIVAFGIYLTLISRIGVQSASYALVLTPIVALSISSIFENFHWTSHALIGIGLVLLGNVLIRKGAAS